MYWSRAVCAALLLAGLFIAGCAVPALSTTSIHPEMSPWRGRLAVRIDADQPQTQAQSFSAEFELSGNAQFGELTLFTPLGTTAATLRWSAQTAALRNNGEVRYFESLNALIKQTLGTEVPVAALFAWLAGDNMEAAGWSADLSQQASGRITARRLQPAPLAELRVVLEK
jgi:outer membrane lipoprotein LolB